MTFYTPSQVASMWSVHITTIYRNHQLQWRKVGRKLVISQADLDKYLSSAQKPTLPSETNKSIIEVGAKLDMGRKKGNYFWYGYGGVYLRKGKKLTRYYIDYYEGKTRRRVMVKSAITVEDALRELQKRVRSINGSAKYSTLNEYADKYMDTYAKAKRSIKADKSRIVAVREFFGDKDLRDIKPSDIEAFRQSRIAAGNSKSTANRFLSLLSRILNLAVQDGYAETNPAKYIKKFSESESKVEHILSVEDEERLMYVCPQYLKDMVFLALHTGMREGEIMALKWDCVDFKGREIRVEHTKSGKYRHVPMDSEVCVQLSSLFKKGERYVFVNKRTGKPYTNIFKTFDRYRTKAGLKQIRFHDLRHTFLTRLVESGADIGIVQLIAGHSDLKITQRYIHPSKQSALKSVENLLDNPDSCHATVTNCFSDMDKKPLSN